MILEWISFPNEVHSRMKFALHSQDTIDGAQVFAPAHKSNFITMHLSQAFWKTCMHHPVKTTQFAILIPGWSLFSVYMTPGEISYQNENFIWIENWNELIPEWLIRKWNFDSISCKQTQRNIWNELVPEWVILVSCKQPVKQFSLNCFTNGNIQN